MQDDLIAIGSRAAIEVGAQRALGEQAQRIGTALGRCHLIADSIIPWPS